MAMVTQSACNSNISKTLSYEDNHNNMRDASFSFYLNGTEESFVLKLAESSHASQEHLFMGRKKIGDGEIGVFGAERYFNGGIEEETPRIASRSARTYPCKEDEPIHLEPMKPKIQSGTPSVHSELSWNSQSVLLQSVVRNPSRSETNKARGKSFLSSLGCKCSCSDKDSIDIDEHDAGGNNLNRTAKASTNEPVKTGLNPVDAVQISKPRSEAWVVKEEMQSKSKRFDKLGVKLNEGNSFTSPIISSGAGNMPIKVHFQGNEDANEAENPRESLEVFGSPILDKKNKSLTLERRLTMLSWNAHPGAEEIDVPPVASDGVYNDADSDASSDLFEIESLTGKANPFLMRQASDGTSGCRTPTTCYAPSEASIEWSVVTASAADFSVMSDYEERRPASIVSSPSRKVVATATATATAKPATNKEITRRRPNILLGCKSHKAVRVAGEAYRTNEKAIFAPQMSHRPDSFAPVTRFQAEAKLIGFEPRHGQHAFATRLIPRTSEPAHASHLLFIQ